MTYLESLERFDDRTLLMLFGGVSLLLLAAALTYLVVPQVRALAEALETRDTLRSAVAGRGRLQAELDALRAEIDALRTRVHGDMANRPLKQMESYIIGRLQKISWSHNVELRGVQPGQGRQVHMFREIMFDVELAGDYFSLVRWLRDLDSELGFVVVKEYEMRPEQGGGAAGSALLLKLKMVSYRTLSA